MVDTVMHIVVGRHQWRAIMVEAYKAGEAPWGEVFRELFNGGWRGPVDRNGFPTTYRGP